MEINVYVCVCVGVLLSVYVCCPNVLNPHQQYQIIIQHIHIFQNVI